MERWTGEKWIPAQKLIGGKYPGSRICMQRLAAYEDTGLTPEEIMGWLGWRWCRLELPKDGGDYLVTMGEPGYNGGRPYTN